MSVLNKASASGALADGPLAGVVVLGGYVPGSPPVCWAIMLATPTPRWGAAGSQSFTPQFGTAIGLLK